MQVHAYVSHALGNSVGTRGGNLSDIRVERYPHGEGSDPSEDEALGLTVHVIANESYCQCAEVEILCCSGLSNQNL